MRIEDIKQIIADDIIKCNIQYIDSKIKIINLKHNLTYSFKYNVYLGEIDIKYESCNTQMTYKTFGVHKYNDFVNYGIILKHE